MDAKKLVIVGGGFAGGRLAYEIEKAKVPVSVTLVDTKDFYEIYLGTLRALVHGRSIGQDIVFPHTAYLKHTKVVVASCTSIGENEITLDNGDTLPFDFLAVCAGSTYPILKSNATNARTVEQRLEQYDAEASRIKASNGVIVVGSGPAGVELVGEIADMYPDKPVTLVTASDRLLPSMLQSSSNKMAEIMSKGTPHVKIIYSDQLAAEKNADGKYVTAKGAVLDGDCVYMATGAHTTNGFIDPAWLDSNGRVKVEPNLRVVGKSNIFCAGDLNNINEGKLAYRAEYHGKLIAKHIAALVKDPNAKLKDYSISRPILILNYGTKVGLGEIPFFGTVTRIIPTYKAKTLLVPPIRASLGLPPPKAL